MKSVSTIADGIAVIQPGENTFSLISDYVDDIALVSDDEVASAILALIEKRKMIAEGAGAVAAAAVMANKFDLNGKRVVAVVSGGNIDVTSLSRVIDRGPLNSGRSSSLLIALIAKPGQGHFPNHRRLRWQCRRCPLRKGRHRKCQRMFPPNRNGNQRF